MSENQDDVPKPDAPAPQPDGPEPKAEASTPKPDVPPPSLSKGPAEPPPPSMTGGAASPPPPSLSSPPPPPPVQGGGAEPLKVKVKPDSDDSEEEDEKPRNPLVSLGNRVGAFMIDAGIALGMYIAALIVLPNFAEKLAWLLAMAYIATRDGLPFLNGQSIGKAAMKIRAVTQDGQSLSGNWQPALVRNVVLLIPLFPLIELVVLLTREDKHDQGVRLGDEWAKTKVIPVEPPRDDDEAEDEGDEDETP